MLLITDYTNQQANLTGNRFRCHIFTTFLFLNLLLDQQKFSDISIIYLNQVLAMDLTAEEVERFTSDVEKAVCMYI